MVNVSITGRRKMKDNNIFDLKDLSDLPEEVVSGLSKGKKGTFEKNIIKLLTTARRPLNIDEVTVGYYRMFGIKKTRKAINMKLYNMSISGNPDIERVKGSRGVYRMRDNLEKEAIDE